MYKATGSGDQNKIVLICRFYYYFLFMYRVSSWMYRQWKPMLSSWRHSKSELMLRYRALRLYELRSTAVPLKCGHPWRRHTSILSCLRRCLDYKKKKNHIPLYTRHSDLNTAKTTIDVRIDEVSTVLQFAYRWPRFSYRWLHFAYRWCHISSAGFLHFCSPGVRTDRSKLLKYPSCCLPLFRLVDIQELVLVWCGEFWLLNSRPLHFPAWCHMLLLLLWGAFWHE